MGYYLSAQEDDKMVFVRYYYESGNVSSEGYLRDYKPDGYWKNFFEDGTLKSEGNRKNFELDSLWKFYYSDGSIQSEIYFRNDKKNGYQLNYEFYYDKDSIKRYFLASKELYFNGLREGTSYYYDISGNLQFAINYKNDKRHGDAKEYDKNGTVITLMTYYNGYLIDNIKINRTDDQGRKQGRWIEFYENGNKKRELNYLNDKLHGFYREYDLGGKIILEQRYINGDLFVPKTEDEVKLKAEIKKAFYPNGKIQYEGAFIDSIPVGIHKEFDENGKIVKVKEYTSDGLLKGEGMYDVNGLRTGEWKLYDPFYEYFYAVGSYEKGLKTGKWTFFYPGNNVEMEGYYEQEKPEKEWIWYYPDGKIRREEVYFLGKREGRYVEYDIEGSVIIKGEYFDGDRTGEWYINVGDIIEKGKYVNGEKDGEWKHYYNYNERLRFIGSFKNGEPDGLHKWFYPNGNVELYGSYRMGKKIKDWKKFNEDGSLYMTFTYRNDVLIKIDGKALKKGKARKK